jgi:calcineurin-like phosphoesterase family protein
MIETWFISDTHFGHKNILEYEPEARPFESLQQMHEVMIERWNSVVKPKDIVYHLGDFAFGRRNISIASRLNGKKRLVMGNHDTYPASEYLPYFDKLYGMIFWERCVLSHMPVHVNGLGSRWMLNVHGHLHSKLVMSNEIVAPEKEYPMNWCLMPDKNYFNVSCEQNNLTPIHKDIILERLKEL